MLSGVYPCWIQPKPRQISVLHISLLPPARTRVLPETLHLVPRLGVLVARVLVAPVLSPWVVPPRWAVPARVALLRELAFDVPWPPTPQVGQKQVLEKTSPISQDDKLTNNDGSYDDIYMYIYIYISVLPWFHNGGMVFLQSFCP